MEAPSDFAMGLIVGYVVGIMSTVILYAFLIK